MKKVLIISGNNHLFTSGADMYTNRLINILKKENCIVDEYSFQFNMTKKDLDRKDDIKIITPGGKFNDCKKSKIKWWFRNAYNVVYKSRKQLDKLIDEYDLVIDSSLMLVRSKKLFNSNKYLYIQHQSADFFEMKRYGFWTPLAVFLIWLTGFKNCFKLAKNIVFYDENNKKYIEKKFKNNKEKKYFTVFNSSITRETIEENRRIKNEIYANNSFERNIIYIGRIAVEQKRLNDINKMMKISKNKLDVYGFGSYEKKILKNKNIIFHGRLKHEDVLKVNLYSKVNLLLSNYEGLSSSMVESICSLTPIIIRDSHISASSLSNNNKNGFLWSNKKNIKEYARQFDEISNLPIEKLKELSNNCYEFAINNLLYETFEEKWKNIYREMIK